MDFLNIGFIASTLISSFVAFIAIIISDKIIAHEMEFKHALIIAVIALFIGPIAGGLMLSYFSLPDMFALYIIPLLIWIILGEIMLKIDRMAKLKVMIVAFVVYFVLSTALTPYIFSIMPAL